MMSYRKNESLLNFLLILSSFFVFSQPAVNNEILETFKTKFLYTHWSHYAIQEYNDQFSKCFKMNTKSKIILKKYYDFCETASQESSKNSSLGPYFGYCSRSSKDKNINSEKSTAHFFNTSQDCKSHREAAMTNQG